MTDPRDELAKIHRRYEALRDAARAQGKAFYEVADWCDRGMVTLKCGSQLLTPSGSTAPAKPLFVLATQWASSQHSLLDKATAIVARSLEDTKTLTPFVTASVMSGTTMVSAVATGMVSLGMSPTAVTIPQFDRHLIQERIDAGLLDVTKEPHMGRRRAEAWVSYQRGSREARVQACHTMRDIVMQLLEEHCRTEDVRKASWWHGSSDAKPSRREQVKYFVLGDKEGPLSSDELEVIERQVDSAFENYALGCKVAHDRQEVGDTTLYGVLADLEDSLYILLDERENVRYQRALAGPRAGP